MLSNFGSIQYVIEQKNSEGTFFEIFGLVEISYLQNYDIISKQFLSDRKFNTHMIELMHQLISKIS